MSAIAPAAVKDHIGINVVALIVLVGLFLVVTVMGFMASRWRRAGMESLDEWGLGGRSFGTWVTWFLLGGDLYTAYTFIAVPAAMFALGSVNGFFAVPYTIVLYPIIFFFMSRLWSVSHRHGFITSADFVGSRYGSRGLSLAVAVTGILATMPYIALQLVGIQAVLEVTGLGGSGSTIAKDLPLFIAFAVLAAYTYASGLRAPALIAFVKDGLIYLVIIVAIIYVPSKVGGWDQVFTAAQHKMTTPAKGTGKVPGAFIPPATQYWAYGTLALGSALALFMYPHSITATLSSKSRTRSAATLPSCRPTALSSVCWHCWAGWPSRPAPSRSVWTESPTHNWSSLSCSRTCSRPGSLASPSQPSRSAHLCLPPSCRSRPRTCSPATSMASGSSLMRPRLRRPRSARWSP